MSMSAKSFGLSKDGISTKIFTLNRAGISVCLISYAAAIQSLLVPDRNGRLADIVLGYDTIAEYEQGSGHQGAVVGRHANRIENAEFILNGHRYQLAANNGRSNLHGGPNGFAKKIWTGEELPGDTFDAVRFTLVSPDGEEGFPGNLIAEVYYKLDDAGALTLDYRARSDQDTIVNLTNHVYFNLAGHDGGSMLDQIMMIPADLYTVVNEEGLPNGEIVRVDGTAFDFRKPKAIGRDIEAPILQNVKGYDHNYVIPGPTGELRHCATATDPVSGRTLEAWSTMPGLQFYSANFLKTQIGKGGCPFGYRNGFCLETQYFPNAMKHRHFPSPILKAGEEYHHTTVFRLNRI